MADAPKLLGTDTLRQAYPKFNQAIDNSNEALKKSITAETNSTNAVNTANQAKTKSEETQQQLDTIVIESGTSDAETLQARGGFPLLKDRLDSTDAQLAQKANAETMLNEFLVRSKPQYGEIKLPVDFIHPGFRLYRNSKGFITHSLVMEQYSGGNIQLWVTDQGNNATGNGSQSNPYRTVHRALQDVVNGSSGSYRINVSNSKIMRAEFADEGASNFISLANKRVAIVNVSDKDYIHVVEAQDSGRGTVASTGGERQPTLTWSLESGSCYRAARTAVAYVTDLTNIDETTKTVKKMQQVNSIAECVSTRGSYYISASDVYVHAYDDRVPDGNIEVLINARGLQFNLTASTLYIEGFYFHNHKGLLVQGDINSLFFENKVKIGRTTEENGLNIRDVGRAFSLDTIIHDSFRDCFNYHYYNIPSQDIRKVLAFEYYCEGFRAGLESTEENNNITTMHEGGNILRVGVIGKETNGTPCADVNGSYSVLIDCHMSGSIATKTGNFSNAYYFYTDVNKSGKGAKVYMENCGGKGEKQDILTDTGTVLTLKSYHEGLDRITNGGTLNIA